MPKTNSPVFKVKAPSFPRQSAAMQRIEVGEVSQKRCLTMKTLINRRQFLSVLIATAFVPNFAFAENSELLIYCETFARIKLDFSSKKRY
jgi:hypothetical protein